MRSRFLLRKVSVLWCLVSAASFPVHSQVSANQNCVVVDDPFTGAIAAFKILVPSGGEPCTESGVVQSYSSTTSGQKVYTIAVYDNCTGTTNTIEVPASTLATALNKYCFPPDESHAAPHAVPRTGGSIAASGQAALGMVVADFNGDGIPDTAWLGSSTVVVQLGTSSGTPGATQQFALPFPTSPGSNQILAADFNGDGKIDLAVNDPGNYTTDMGGVAVLLGNGDGTFGEAKEYDAGAGPSAIAAADFNGSGNIDIAAVGSSVAILPGNGDGTFGAATTFPGGQGLAQAVVAVDLNGDGLPDLAIAYSALGSVVTLLNSAGGKFQSPQITPLPAYLTVDVAYGDLNQDGHEDLVVPDQFTNAVLVLLGNGDGTFQTPVAYAVGMYPGSIALMSLEDGNTVLLTTDNSYGDVMATQITPQGVAGAPLITSVGGEPTAVAAADLTGTGQPAAVVAAGASDVTVMLSKNGQFTLSAGYSLGKPTPEPLAVALGDLNGDGKPDAIVGTAAGQVFTLLGNGDGTFQAPVSTSLNLSAASLALADFNGDGKLDVAAAAFGSPPGESQTDAGGVYVLLGNGNGTFQPPVVLTVSGMQPAAVAAADLNGDGIPDLAALMVPANANAPVALTLAVFLGQGGGKFQVARTFPLQSTGYGLSVGLAIGDVNNDGKPDIVAAGLGQQMDVLLGDGTGNFHEAPSLPSSAQGFSSGLVLTDLFGTGHLDIVALHCCGQTEATFFVGNGDGTFQGEQPLPSDSSPTGVAVTQFNGNPGLIFVNNVDITNRGTLVALEMASPSSLPAPTPSIAADTSAASTTVTTLAPSSIATAWGTNLAASTAGAGAGALPTTLGGSQVTVTDSAGVARAAQLFYASPGQVNYYVPDGTAAGAATVTIAVGSAQGSAAVQIASVSPSIFQLNATGLAAADVVVVGTGGAQTFANVYQVNAAGAVVALPINLSSGQVYLELFGTGLRNAKNVTATVGGASVPVLSSGAQGQYAGLDQVNIGPLPASSRGQVNILVTADGKASNAVNVTVQ